MQDPFAAPEIVESAFLESRNCLAIYNIAPILPGHSLVIPKEAYKSILELDDALMLEFFQLARKATKVLLLAFGAEDFDWTIQDGANAGQTVPHLHLHIVPRRKGDLPHPGDWYPKLMQHENAPVDSEERPRLSSADMRRIVSRLRELAGKSRTNGPGC
jgi:bis(5'-adenosyl)-triphosphatase